MCKDRQQELFLLDRGLLKWHSYFGDIVFEDRNTPDVSRNFCYVDNHGKHLSGSDDGPGVCAGALYSYSVSPSKWNHEEGTTGNPLIQVRKVNPHTRSLSS